MPKLVIIDAANALYRAFFAVPPLRNAEGFPTNAVYGFVSMLRKVLREEAPDAVVVAMDPKGGSFRNALYPAYKANREAQPEDLSVQLPVARELMEALGLPILEVPGFEADDVIATLVRKLPKAWEAVIVSTDKDLMQLVGPRVVLLDTMKDRRLGPAAVEARFGVGPEKLLDVRALVGDPSDNLPGVKGIGEKGAAKLIQEWGDLETLLGHADEVKAKRARAALLAQSDDARLSKQLATLREDVPLPTDPTRLAAPSPDEQALATLYRRLAFTRLLEELEAADETAEVQAPAVGCTLLQDAPVLAAWLDRHVAADCLAMALVEDPATSGLVRDPAGLALAVAADAAVYLPLGHAGIAAPLARSDALAEILAFVERPASGRSRGPGARPWVARDTKRVQSLFAEAGCPLPTPDFDLGLAAFLLDPAGGRSPTALAQQELGRTLRSFETLAGRGAKATPAASLPPQEAARFATEEACALYALRTPVSLRLAAEGLEALFREVELPLSAVLSRMECSGVRVDEDKLAELSSEYERELAHIQARIYALAGEEFSVSSPKQLQAILFEKLKLSPIKKTKTGFSTDESVLKQLSPLHELPAEVLRFRRLAKLKSTYVDALPPLVDARSGRIHPIFHQTGAATGRLSSSHPNVQNIPIRTAEGIRIREAFVPAEGQRLLSADYSQVELRIVAHFSKDESLIEAFASGEDVHRRTAADVAGIDPEEVSADQRAHAKAINFGIIYGSSAFGIANQLGIAQTEAQATIDRYFERYRGVRRFLDETVAQAREDGFVRTLLGRRRFLPDLGSRNRTLRQAAERMAVNTVLQGTAADLIKKAMVDVDQELRDAAIPARMILQVHDELVFEAPERALAGLAELVRDRMEHAVELEVPLVVDIGSGRSWREAH